MKTRGLQIEISTKIEKDDIKQFSRSLESKLQRLYYDLKEEFPNLNIDMDVANISE